MKNGKAVYVNVDTKVSNTCEAKKRKNERKVTFMQQLAAQIGSTLAGSFPPGMP
jgi:hypothetical protein